MQDINKLLIITGATLAATLVLGYHVVTDFGNGIRIAKTSEACSHSLLACHSAQAKYNTEYLCKAPVLDSQCWTEVK